MIRMTFTASILLLSMTACKKGHHTKAELEAAAKEYADKEGGNAKAVSCVTLDSDGDHYVTCTVFYGDNQHKEILCTIDDGESGCKAKP